MLKKQLFMAAIVVAIFSPTVTADFKTFPGADLEQKQLTKWYQKYQKNKAHIKDVLGAQFTEADKDVYVNSLIDSSSPYLLRHAFNPILWVEWTEQALAKAEQENKLVFLSVGYSSCHWCHVMEHESFIDEEVAAVLNQSYVAIKVDKEVSPNLDYKYTLALELSKGSSGWPISAILTPQGDVIYIDAYIGKQKLIKILQRLSQNWQKNKAFFEQSSKYLMSEVNKVMGLSGELKAIKKSELPEYYQQISSKFDQKYGGLFGEVKFPEPALILTLLDQYQRNADPELKRFIEHSLDNLYHKNMFDHVYGGFYRYTTDNEYQVPHFEKMLYTQAYMISAYSKAASILGNSEYLDVAKQTLEFCEQWMKSEQGLFYSAIDADYKGVEGGYYLWDGRDRQAFEQTHRNKVNWLAIDGKHLPIYPISVEAKNLLKEYTLKNRNQSRPFIDKKSIVAWNALMVQSFLDMYKASVDQQYLIKAEQLAETLWKNTLVGKDSSLARFVTQVGSSHKANIEDSVELALALVALHDVSPEKNWLEKANKVQNFIDSQQLSTDQQSPKLYSLTSLQNVIANDSEGYSALARLYKLLSKYMLMTKDQSFKYKLKQLKQVVSKRVSDNLLARIYSYLVLKEQIEGEISDVHYFAQGHGKARLVKENGSFTIKISMDGGWHVNSEQPTRKELIPTSVEVFGLPDASRLSIDYPDFITKSLAFSKLPLTLFEKQFEVGLDLSDNLTTQALVKINLQACSDKVCLLPEQLFIPLMPLRK
ncbi:MAG: thioredoxin domain-containing protein [Kangiellaceae bacterium]|nr:thioredoxin domain-containing protein [Kangiellaceae bacterium]